MLEHVLYSFRRCPYAIRARTAIYYAGITVQVREVVLRDKPAELLRISPKGTVPVLVTGSGVIIEESLDIMRWALQQYDPGSWLSPGNTETIEQLIAENDNNFKPLLDQYKYPERSGTTTEAARACCLPWITHLEQRLATNPFLVADHMTLADAAVLPFIRQFRGVDQAWFDGADFPHLQAWLTTFLTSEIFEVVMQKYQPWDGVPDAYSGQLG